MVVLLGAVIVARRSRTTDRHNHCDFEHQTSSYAFNPAVELVGPSPTRYESPFCIDDEGLYYQSMEVSNPLFGSPDLPVGTWVPAADGHGPASHLKRRTEWVAGDSAWLGEPGATAEAAARQAWVERPDAFWIATPRRR